MFVVLKYDILIYNAKFNFFSTDITDIGSDIIYSNINIKQIKPFLVPNSTS